MALKVYPVNRLRRLRPASGSRGSDARSPESEDLAPEAAVHKADSTMPRLKAHVTIATTNKWAKTIRMPSRPYGASTSAISSVIIGPRLHATWVRPSNLLRALRGANSPTRASDVGTSAPTAIPTRKVPMKSIGVLNAKTIHNVPKA
jgi:hypothetical protein